MKRLLNRVPVLVCLLLALLLTVPACVTVSTQNTEPASAPASTPATPKTPVTSPTHSYSGMVQQEDPDFFFYIYEQVLILKIASVSDETIVLTDRDNAAPGTYHKVLFDILYHHGNCHAPLYGEEADPYYPGGIVPVERLIARKGCVWFAASEADTLKENDLVLCAVRSSTTFKDKEWHLIAEKIRRFEDGKLVSDDQNALYTDYSSFLYVNLWLNGARDWPEGSWCDDLIKRTPKANIENGVDYLDLIGILKWTEESITVFSNHYNK